MAKVNNVVKTEKVYLELSGEEARTLHAAK